MYRWFGGAVCLGFAVGMLACGGAARPEAPGSRCSKCDTLTPATRADWVIERVAGFSPEKLDAIDSSPFKFFRGTNNLYWEDVGRREALSQFGGPATYVWLQGDMHTENFGTFGDGQGGVIYDLNDFDEAVIGDYQLDLWRLAASVALVFRANNAAINADAPLDEKVLDDVLKKLASSYLETLRGYLHQGKGPDDHAEVGRTFSSDDTDELLLPMFDDVGDREKMLGKWTKLLKGGTRELRDESDYDPGKAKLAEVDSATSKALEGAFSEYVERRQAARSWPDGYFLVKSVRRRLGAGTGSLGAMRFYVLIEGASESSEDDRILDIKQQGDPAPQPYLDPEVAKGAATIYDNNGHRVELGRQALGYRAAPDVVADPHAGWLELSGDAYSVAERSPQKESFDTDVLSSAEDFTTMARLWGEILATAHARADNDWNAAVIDYSFEAAVAAATEGAAATFASVVAEIGRSYADQVALDFESFTQWRASQTAAP